MDCGQRSAVGAIDQTYWTTAIAMPTDTAMRSTAEPRQLTPKRFRSPWIPRDSMLPELATTVGSVLRLLAVGSPVVDWPYDRTCWGGWDPRHFVWHALQYKRRVPFSHAPSVRLVWLNCSEQLAQVNLRLAGPRDIGLAGLRLRTIVTRSNRTTTEINTTSATPRPARSWGVSCMGTATASSYSAKPASVDPPTTPPR